MWYKVLQEVFADICKYIFTAVVVTTLFAGIEDKTALVLLGVGIALICLVLACAFANIAESKEKAINKKKRR